jgi:structural maintenance of chromosome 3 (chondroitin sulfate proteoglycan 6)
MVGELSQDAQYIATTFRAELIPHADSYYGVLFNQAKVSTVKERAFSAPFPFFSSSLWRARELTLCAPQRTVTADECSQFIEAAENVRA